MLSGHCSGGTDEVAAMCPADFAAAGDARAVVSTHGQYTGWPSRCGEELGWAAVMGVLAVVEGSVLEG
jgi:hypothetical protein